MFRPLSRTRSLVRTGFFRSDPLPPAKPYYFIDPEDPLFSIADEYRYTDDPTMRNPVLERSNVGMGMLLVNSGVSNTHFTNLFYRKLRDLEVNTLKRFVAVTMSDRQLPVGPIGLRHLLLLSEASKRGDLREIATSLLVEALRNQADLALVVNDYFKPLLTLVNGSDSGVAIASLANNSACYANSFIQLDLVKYGMVPTGGLSYALARAPWHIGEFLSMTSRKITGQNILYCGLAKRWVSPEAFPFLEVTSEHKLDVSEKDATALLSEHFLPPPTDWVLRPFVNVINEAFGHEHFEDVVRSLKRTVASSSDSRQAAFAQECLDRLSQADPLALRLTHALIRRARNHLSTVTRMLQEDQGNETVTFIERRPRLFQEHIGRPAMIESLKDEVRVASRLVFRDEFRKALHNHIMGESEGKDGLASFSISSAQLAQFFEPLRDDYMYSERSDFPLSAHPKLRRYHPDFNPKTGMDHDPQFMAREVERWSDHYMREELIGLRSAVTGLSGSQLETVRWD
jgi:enoyl-CoA hydratase/carnithine racemase